MLALLVDRLRELREDLWDPAAGLDRVPPGAAPGVDVAALGLHIVRESAYGALADLEDGRIDRAVATLRRVLALQLDAPGRPWDGTFPVTAEQPPPPYDGAVEWLHWDPNWRQFVGTALALVVARHASSLPADLVDDLVTAVRRCVAGEPDDRIPPWYTNPDLLHAWLLGWVGARDGSAALLAAGEARATAAADRVRRHGDVDEYSSPTYDGVDLLAAGLWATHPPSPAYASIWRRWCWVRSDRGSPPCSTPIWAPWPGPTSGPTGWASTATSPWWRRGWWRRAPRSTGSCRGPSTPPPTTSTTSGSRRSWRCWPRP